MTDPLKSIRSLFFSSPHHAVMAVSTLGVGFLTGEPLYFILGATAYVLGWIYVPDLPFFQRWVEKKQGAAAAALAQAELADFGKRRDALIASLSSSGRDKYRDLAAVCQQIEKAAVDGEDPRVRKLEELMWTYLRLLSIQHSLEQFLETERREDVPRLLAAAEVETQRVTTELEAQKQKGGAKLDSLEKLLASRRELLETLHKRSERLEQGRSNLALVVSEQERLEQQIKLIRADSIASRNATALSARIDATVEHLEHTNQWLREMDQFQDLLTDLPQNSGRVGFGAPNGPPPIPATAFRGKERA